MFFKPFHIKSNVQIKGTERKKLRARVAAAFPQLAPEQLELVVPARGELCVVRAVTRCNTQVQYYQHAGQPLLLELPPPHHHHQQLQQKQQECQLVPTVYTLWRLPQLQLLPCFSTHEPVVQRLRAGADLMLPGVVVDRSRGPRMYGRLHKGQLVAVNTETNRAPIAVGYTALSSDDMFMAGGRGKCVLIVHALGDYLWLEGSRCEAPRLDVLATEADGGGAANGGDNVAAAAVLEAVETVTETVGEMELSEVSVSQQDALAAPAAGANSPQTDSAAEADGVGACVDMDQLLFNAFRQACKCHGKKISLPILVSSFYAQYVVTSSAEPLDVKRSSYKKLSKFLERMQRDGLIDVQELTGKGVQSVVAINTEHPDIQCYRAVKIERPSAETEDATTAAAAAAASTGTKYHTKQFESIEELLAVSGNVAPLFKALHIAKGEIFSAGEVRTLVTNYVKTKQLQVPGQSTHVTLDRTLTAAVFGSSSDRLNSAVTWSELHQLVLARMAPVYRLHFVGDTLPATVKRGAVPCVELSTAVRSGNKRVTLVLNLDVFGVDPHEFAHRCQLGAGASTSVGAAAHRAANTVQVMVQGNQVRFIGQLLQQHYRIPKRYIVGLDKASKK